ncbi:MAG: 4Fe-4S binding protein [Polyangia bacterium]|jgi:NADH-quinone oxidoreductase subunit I|nr:4Fe-4S binding protein [Polyangia bacterium]
MPARTVKLEPPSRDILVESYLVESAKGVGITLRHFFRNFLSIVPWVTLGVIGLGLGLAGVLAMFALKGIAGRMDNLVGFLAVFGALPASFGLLALLLGALRQARRQRPPNYLRLRPYPDIPADYYPARFRGEHRLMRREDDSVRCVSCMMCATVCPADCIHIVAQDASSDEARKDQDAPKESMEKYPVRFEIDELRCVVCGFCVEACPCDAIRMDTGVHVAPMSDRSGFIFDRGRLLERGELSLARQGGEGPGWRERQAPPPGSDQTPSL